MDHVEHTGRAVSHPGDNQPTHVGLWRGAEILLNKGKADGPGSQWIFLSSLLLLSLCLEAYLNFAGPIVFGPDWHRGEAAYADRSATAKLVLIATACGVDLDGRPKYWTVVNTLLELRQSMTHPRQRRLDKHGDTGNAQPAASATIAGGPARPVEPAWSPYCRADVVLGYATQLKSLCESLHAALPRQGQGREWLSPAPAWA